MNSNRNLTIVVAPRWRVLTHELPRVINNNQESSEILILTDYGKPTDKLHRSANIAMIDQSFLIAIEDRPRLLEQSLQETYYCFVMSIFALANIRFILDKLAIKFEMLTFGQIIHPKGCGNSMRIAPLCYPLQGTISYNNVFEYFEIDSLVCGRLHGMIIFFKNQCIGGNGLQLFKSLDYSLYNLFNNESKMAHYVGK